MKWSFQDDTSITTCNTKYVNYTDSEIFLFPECKNASNCEFIPQDTFKKGRFKENVLIKGGIKLPCEYDHEPEGSVFAEYADSFSKKLIFLKKTEEKSVITFLLGTKDNNSVLNIIPTDIVDRIIKLYIRTLYESNIGISFFQYNMELCKQFVSKRLEGLPLDRIRFLMYDSCTPKVSKRVKRSGETNKVKRLFPAEIYLERKGVFANKGISDSDDVCDYIYLIVLWKVK